MKSQTLSSLLPLLVTILFYHVTQCDVTTGRPNVSCTLGGLYANPDDCSKFYQCVPGIPTNGLEEMSCKNGTVFSEKYWTCVHRGSQWDKCTPANIERECQKLGVGLIPHPTECQLYYDCSDNSAREFRSFYGKYEKECTYPEVFDINLKRCVGYEYATCGEGRVLPKWVCQYKVTFCPVASCRPCYIDNPSCIGKEDGLWPTAKVGSPYFTTCKSERSVNGEESCGLKDGKQQLFDAEKRRCVTSP